MNTNSFLLLRLAIGASMLGHGLVRLPKLQTFSHWMVGSFAKSILPQALLSLLVMYCLLPNLLSTYYSLRVCLQNQPLLLAAWL